MSNNIFQGLEFRAEFPADTLRRKSMLDRKNTVLIFVDVQGKLAELVDGSEALFSNLRRLLEGMNALEVPVVVTEQIPEKLGPTREEFRPLLKGEAVAKHSFSCCGEPAFCKTVEALKRTQVILCGIETHICVYQTALDLMDAGYEVHVATDAVSSRDPANKALALRRLEVEGACLTGTEMILFELLGDARDPAFKSVLQIVK
jgi:nicotinamidase-related amidase